MEENTLEINEKECLNCGKTFKLNGTNRKYCSDFCSNEYRVTNDLSVRNKDKDILKFSEIPIKFILNNIKPYQITAIEIKYHIHKQAELWEEKKHQLYENLSIELNLSWERVRKIAKERYYAFPTQRDC